ncbi:discoidin domain-containing protein [Rossellomorea sp. GCM10028870]|uniref:endo-beta-N-acetylglucosaminidase n=1 Tax=Rossellomorea sp. GCM10028870 TaxID=3273426 RepID=UPI0036218613
MKNGKKRIVGSLMFFVLFLFPLAVSGEGPTSSHWYPEELLEWSPEQDPDAAYNRSMVPLAKRVESSDRNNAARVVALSALNPHTSGVPSQGGKEFYANTFAFWQYVDVMVYWAGSSGEGIIVPPSADVIDASHRNGVPILGNVFFPPKVYGGKEEWVDQMLTQREDGSFPAADKLLEVAEYYGFDGWFINQETEGGDGEQAEKMQEFLTYLQDHKPTDFEIMWYDSMVKSGEIDWQNYLTDENTYFLQDKGRRVSDSMFLNFWWKGGSQERSYEKALEIGRSPYDLYAGIDVEANGTKTSVKWDNLVKEDGSLWTSLGIYRPDWAFKTSSSMNEFYQKEEAFWTGDPEVNWPGISSHFTEKTTIQSLPFTTNFNTGSGEFFAIDGEKSSEQEWNNRSLQDILPTWRWKVDGEGELLNPAFDWSTSYYGGSSLKVHGTRDETSKTTLSLYETDVEITKDTKFSITYKTDEKKPEMDVQLDFDDDKTSLMEVKKKSRGGWVTQTFNLTKFKGHHLSAVSLHFDKVKEPGDYEIHIGEIKIYNDKDEKEKPKKPTGLEVSHIHFIDGLYADVRLSWNKMDEVKQYEVYRIHTDGSKEWVGATPNHVLALNDLKRNGKETATSYELVPVSEELVRGDSSVVTMDWPAYPKPEADFRVDQTVVRPGDKVQFFSEASEVTEEWEWQFEGGQPEVSSEENPVVHYPEEGLFSVTLTARNTSGEDVKTKQAYIYVSEDADATRNVALNKSTESSGACAPSEGADKAVDGEVENNSKWCALGTDQWMVVDLGDTHHLSKFIVKHAEAGGESPAFNTKSFVIETSMDGETWKENVSVEDNQAAVTEHTIAVTEARFVRLSINEPTQTGDQAARIYELEVYGY